MTPLVPDKVEMPARPQDCGTRQEWEARVTRLNARILEDLHLTPADVADLTAAPATLDGSRACQRPRGELVELCAIR